MTQYSVAVPSIGCEGCITNLTEALIAADAAATVKGDAATKQLWVTTQLTEAAVVAAVTDAGHEVATIAAV